MNFSGNSAYCYSNSLQMCLQHAGMADVPAVGLLEAVTGMPFGTCFLDLDQPMFFASPAGTEPHEGLSRALATLGWSCQLWQGDEPAAAQATLVEALQSGPVLVGPLDMGHLVYDPQHENKAGGDHFLVALSIDGELVTVHDPQYYPYALLSLSELLLAWDAAGMAYIDHRFTLRHGFHQEQTRTWSEIVAATLAAAHKLQTQAVTGPVFYSGAAAFAKARALVEATPAPAFAGLLTHFSLPIGARRSLDAEHFMLAAGEQTLSERYGLKARLYGQAQYWAATQQWPVLADILRQLEAVEGELMRLMA
ncbi:MAG: hypothetical protein KDE04_21735 [Anaerolineales bacterium]|nr:hypothetical protein [Anaerolineales bacterium]